MINAPKLSIFSGNEDFSEFTRFSGRLKAGETTFSRVKLPLFAALPCL